MSTDVDDQGVSVGDPYEVPGMLAPGWQSHIDDGAAVRLAQAVIHPGEAGECECERWRNGITVCPVHGTVKPDDAPYGRNPRNGKPYKMSAEARAQLGAKLAQARADAAERRGDRKAPPRGPRGSTGPPRAPRPKGPNYALAVAGILQLPAYALGVGARVVPSLALDAIALSIHTPNIAEAVGQLAEEDPRIAAILDRVMAVGPYGALFAAITPLIMQIMCNHGLVKPTPMMGTLSEDELYELVAPKDPEES